MKYFSVLLLSFLAFVACNEPKTVQTELPTESIFRLTSDWQNQDNQTMQLKDLQGKTLVVVMIYTSCKTACPVLVAKMKSIEAAINSKAIDKVSLVLVSIDPKVDIPERLKEFAIKNNMDNKHWVFLTSNETNTQEFANVLSMKYKKISPIDFSHSNIVSIFSPDGQMVTQEEGLEIDIQKIADIVNQTVKKFK
ncbi:MAG TPA: SCO family protein [Edaphocola sp.]|nr:SCO family protein [Edaphocola sp.]